MFFQSGLIHLGVCDILEADGAGFKSALPRPISPLDI